MAAGFGGPPILAQHLGYTQYSRDRGRTWEGPYRMPSMGFEQVYMKPDYLVRPDGLVLLFVTVGSRSCHRQIQRGCPVRSGIRHH